MKLIKIGKKIISRTKLERLILRILHLRARGSTQQEVARELGIERTFISRLEGLGEVEEPNRAAVVIYDLPDAEEYYRLAVKADFEPIAFPANKEFADTGGMMEFFAGLSSYDFLVFVAPERLIKAAEKIFGHKVHGYPAGREGNGHEGFGEFLEAIAGAKKRGRADEGSSQYKLGLFEKKSYSRS